jgi:cytidylate kinase
MKSGLVITIDGPSGAGKSTIAVELARRLGWSMLDTGSMYRVVTWAAITQLADLNDPEALGRLAAELDARFDQGRVWVGTREVSSEIRDPEISRKSGFISKSQPVRQVLAVWQKREAAKQNIVTEGRDQGTIIFPDAIAKFFLTASDEERARRRHRELLDKGHDISLEQVLADQQERDRRDEQNALAPMKPADDATVIDSSTLAFEEVLELMLSHVQQRIGQKGTADEN